MAKGILIVVWVLAIAGFFVAPETGLASIARWVFWIMLGAHVIEFIVFRQKKIAMHCFVMALVSAVATYPLPCR